MSVPRPFARARRRPCPLTFPPHRPVRAPQRSGYGRRSRSSTCWRSTSWPCWCRPRGRSRRWTGSTSSCAVTVCCWTARRGEGAPGAVESRQQAIALPRILAALRLPAGADGDQQAGAPPATPCRCPWHQQGRGMKARAPQRIAKDDGGLPLELLAGACFQVGLPTPGTGKKLVGATRTPDAAGTPTTASPTRPS
jgi:hypothetical protein